MRPITPRGFRDVLPAEAAEREATCSALTRAFSSWGYEPVETPVVEVYETLSAAAGDLQGTAFRLFDLDGRLLALRPDMTVPIARLFAARMAERPGVKRFRYEAQVFREHESLRGQARQFTQLGVELVGAGGPAADAEVLTVFADALHASGLRDFTLACGDVAVLVRLIDAADIGVAWREAVLAAAHDRNLVALDGLAASAPGPVAEALREVVRLRGGVEAIERCRAVVTPIVGDSEVARFSRMWELLEAAGVAGRVLVDFGIIRSFDYYTGLVVEAYAPGLGVALGGGGRYDGLLAAYGAPRSAAGFAIGLERLSIALADQGVTVPVAPVPEPVGGDAVAAFAEAARRRARGERVVLADEVFGGEEVVR